MFTPGRPESSCGLKRRDRAWTDAGNAGRGRGAPNTSSDCSHQASNSQKDGEWVNVSPQLQNPSMRSPDMYCVQRDTDELDFEDS